MIKTIAFCLTAMTAFQSAAQASTTIDFDSTRGRNGDTGYVYGPYKEDGYHLSSSACSKPAGTCFVTTGTTLTSLDRVGAALTNFQGSAVTTLQKIDGSAFLLESMDIAGNYGNFSGYSSPTLGAEFTFNFLDGTKLVQNYILQNTAGQRLTVNSLDFNLAPLMSFSWKPTTGTSGFLQFDNIVLNDVPAVPEPATWAMMITGFGLTGAAMRRRSRIAALA